ncbi:MAG TPA: M90 family metallopeptidase [Steroidobacteraceae bacterium]|nr:M90 family metallopeptidase [Steroidobacteraceae bacterium]
MTPSVVVVAIAVVVIAVLLGRPLWQARRRRRLRARPLPQAWRDEIVRAMPIYAHIPQPLRARLDGLVQQFVAEKEFVGCRGLEVTLAMKLVVAAQACLLVLGRSARLYEDLYAILIYPAAFLVPEEHRDEAGVVHQHERALSGQAWDTHRIILSWDDVIAGAQSPDDGHNLVYHEFAHYLDAEGGIVNGAPLLGEARHYERWSRVMQNEFIKLREADARGEPTVLDPYGAENPGEFFAVATEAFFELPHDLQAEHAELYTELRSYFRLDPASWLQSRA